MNEFTLRPLILTGCRNRTEEKAIVLRRIPKIAFAGTLLTAIMGLTSAFPASAATALSGPTADKGSLVSSRDPSTLKSKGEARILEAGCPRGPNRYDIGIGNTGTAVSEVQCLLNVTLSVRAYPFIPVNGIYDSFTANGVRVFQACANGRNAGIAVDGRVGRETLPHLRWWGQYTYDTGELMC